MRPFSLKIAALSVFATVFFAPLAHAGQHHGQAYKHKMGSYSPMVFFDTAKAVLKSDATQALTKALHMMENNPDKVMCLIGHADYRGSSEYNKVLSEERAQAVKQFLQNCSQDYRYAFAVVGAGEEYPVFKGSGDAILAKNRNVVISIVDSASQCKP